MTKLLKAGFGMKILRWERDLRIFTGGMRDSFEIDGGIRRPAPITRGIGINILSGAGWRD